MKLFKRSDSSYYQAHFVVGQRLFRISTRETDEAKAREVAIAAKVEREVLERHGVNRKTMSVKNAYDETISHLNVKKKKDYGYIFDKHIKPNFAQRDLSHVNESEIFSSLIDISLARKQRVCVVWRKLFESAVRTGHDIRTPSLKLPRPEMNARSAFNDQEIDHLRKALRERHNEYSVPFADRKYKNRSTKQISRTINVILYYYFCLLVATGMRPGSEALSLRWADCMPARLDGKDYRKFLIRPETTKVRKAREAIADYWFNDVWFSIEVWHKFFGLDAINKLIVSDRDGWQPKRLDFAFKNLLKQENMLYDTNGNERCLYSIRHFYITKKLAAGKPIHSIAKQCGNSVAIIERAYDKTISSMMARQIIE